MSGEITFPRVETPLFSEYFQINLICQHLLGSIQGSQGLTGLVDFKVEAAFLIRNFKKNNKKQQKGTAEIFLVDTKQLIINQFGFDGDFW